MGTNDAWMTRNPQADSDEPFDAEPGPAPAPKKRRASSTAGETAPAVKRSRAAPRSDFRIAEQPGFVLHSYPYRETSLVIDVFSRDYGRVALVAKGAKRPHSALRGVLQTFQPLGLSWSGKGEVRTLTTAEWVGGAAASWWRCAPLRVLRQRTAWSSSVRVKMRILRSSTTMC